MAYPLIYPALEWLLGIGATGAGVAASNNEEVPVSSWSLHDNPVGRGLHWLFDPKWGGFATAMTYSPTTIERMPDGSYFGYQSWNNPDGTFGSEIRPNTLGTVTVMSRPRYSVISSRLYDEAPSDSIGTAPAQPAQPAQPASASGSGSTAPAPANPDPQQDPEQNNSSNSGNSGNQRKPSFRERQKKVLNRIKKGYGNALVGLEYGLGFGAPIAGLGYGVYKWMQPNKTRADSILDSQLYQVGELNKAVQINENQKKIDAVLQQIQSGSPQTQSNDSNYIAPQQVVNPTDTLDF